MEYTNVTTTQGNVLKGGIQDFKGMAPQYYAFFEVPMIEDLILPENAAYKKFIRSFQFWNWKKTRDDDDQQMS